MNRLKQFLVDKIPRARLAYQVGDATNMYSIITIGRLADTTLFSLIWEFHEEYKFALEEVWANSYILVLRETGRRYSITISHDQEDDWNHKLHIRWSEITRPQ